MDKENDPDDALARVSLIEALLQSYENLAQASQRLLNALQADIDYPLFLPTYPQNERISKPEDTRRARNLAAKSLTELFNLDEGEPFLRAGLLCASSETLFLASEFNQAKLEFKAIVLQLRQQKKGQHKPLDYLIEQVLPPETTARPEHLVNALKQAQLSRLDLTRCYCLVRALPDSMQSISWTWATTHASTRTVSCIEARTLAAKLGDKAKNAVLRTLADYPDDYAFSYRESLPNRSQANLVYTEDGSVKRKTVVTSGIVLCPSHFLPRVKWRDDPGKPQADPLTSRLKRSDAKISEEKVIHALNLYKPLPK